MIHEPEDCKVAVIIIITIPPAVQPEQAEEVFDHLAVSAARKIQRSHDLPSDAYEVKFNGSRPSLGQLIASTFAIWYLWWVDR